MQKSAQHTDFLRLGLGLGRFFFVSHDGIVDGDEKEASVSWRLTVRQERGSSSTTGGVTIAKTIMGIVRRIFVFLCLL
jgi:hypothetical protein